MDAITQSRQRATMTAALALGFGLDFDALYRCDGLAAIDAQFVEFLRQRDRALQEQLTATRAAPDALEVKAEKDLVLALALVLDDFLAELIGIAAEVATLRARDRALTPIYTVKRLFVQRRAAKKFTPGTGQKLRRRGVARRARAPARRRAHRIALRRTGRNLHGRRSRARRDARHRGALRRLGDP